MISISLGLLLTCQLSLVPADNVTERRSKFPCPTEYGESRPLHQTTVHTLRPKDVDLVASVGDR